MEKSICLVILFSLFFTNSCRNSENKSIVLWEKRIKEFKTKDEYCLLKDSLILKKLIDSTCSCKLINIDNAESCDSLVNSFVR